LQGPRQLSRHFVSIYCEAALIMVHLAVLAALLAMCLVGAMSAECGHSIYGESGRLFGFEIRTFAEVYKKQLVKVGVEFPFALFPQLRPYFRTNISNQYFSLDFPREAQAAGIHHLQLDWLPRGHEPPGIYNVPHFDIHFHLVTEAERLLFTDASLGVNATPPLTHLPPNYIPIGGLVPQMGLHWGDANSPEFHGHNFSHAFIYGTYNRTVTFIEPMMTPVWLKQQQHTKLAVPQPKVYEAPRLLFPKSYVVEQDKDEEVRRVYLTDFFTPALRGRTTTSPPHPTTTTHR